MNLKSLTTFYQTLQAEHAEFVLATIITAEGSTYRKPGARMIISRTGEFSGLLGGGSFELALAQAAVQVFESRAPAVIDCEMPGPADPFDPQAEELGERDGIARILLQWQSPENAYRPMSLIAETMEARQSKVLITVTDSAHPQAAVGDSFLPGQSPAPQLPAALQREIEATAQTVLDSGKPMLVHHPAEEGEVEVFYAILRPPLGLLIIGAGADAVPLTRFAALLGWDVTVVDAREWLAQPAHFPDAGRVYALQPEQLEQAVASGSFQAAVLMTHSSALDERFLRRLLETRVPYIGVLGSKSRCRKLLDSLGELGEKSAERIRSPVGLKIGAESPEEIALSIIAEIQSGSARLLEVVPARVQAPVATASALAQGLDSLYAVILAAGGSKRFGALKQLLELQGESLLRRVVKTANQILGGRVIVVHGPKATKCRREIAAFSATHVVNEYWESGMALSLKLGIRALPEHSAAVLILLCDQPLVGPAQVQSLVEAWTSNPEKIVASAYAASCGVPAIIPRRYFAELLQLTGDRGAQAIIVSHETAVHKIPLPEAEIDIDTQDDYTQILKRQPG